MNSDCPPCRQVDIMLRTFKAMNEAMRKAQSFKPVATKEELLQMVAQNNLLFTDIISKLGIMERFDIAWKSTNCNDVYEHLRADMEIENRNSNLQVKVRPALFRSPAKTNQNYSFQTDLQDACLLDVEPFLGRHINLH